MMRVNPWAVRMRLLLAGAAALAAANASPVVAQVQRRDWPAYGRDAGGQRYSPLTQIKPSNVSKLQVAWTYHMNPAGPGSRAQANNTTPLVVGNRMFVGTPYGRIVALDATTGKEVWVHQLPPNEQPPLRGIGYWPGDKTHGARLVFGTQRGLLVALDAATGRPASGFGDNGIVNTRTPEIMNRLPTAPYGYSAPPTIYKNLAILGSRVQERPSKGAAGDARAWDILTGKLVWTFHSIPQPGEAGHETWEGDSWKQRSGVNQWNMSTVDEARGIAYLSFGAPTYDRYGGDHLGDNLYSSSVVAVNAATGKYLWHFQTTHHDIWDLDQHVPPTLLTVKKDGKSIPAVAVMNKMSLLFILDRVSGKPIFGVEERQVPPSSVVGERASPTQPFPVKPLPLSRTTFDLSEIATVTPEHNALCKAIVAKDNMIGTTTYEPLRDDRITIRFPAATGGPAWGGGAFDPDRGLYIFNNTQMGFAERLVKSADGEWSVVGGRFQDAKTRTPCQEPPWGELIAIDVNTGDVAWRSILGVTDHFPEGKQNTGRASNGGPILTAGGVAFIGGTDDARFRAFDTQTGKELWTFKLDYSAHATPITYQGRDGRQYVAVVAVGGSALASPTGGDSLLAFALPQ